MAYGSTITHGDTGSLNPSSVEAPLSIGDSSSGHGHERSPLAASLSMGRVAAGQTMEKRPQPTEEPAAASILAEGSLNDSRREAAHTFKE